MAIGPLPGRACTFIVRAMFKPSRTIIIRWIVVLLALLAFILWVKHGNPSSLPITASEGKEPKLVEPDSEFFPSVGLATSIGWGANGAPTAAKGLTVTRFAEGLDHPRTMLTLPGGDVLVAETSSPPRAGGSSRMGPAETKPRRRRPAQATTVNAKAP